MLHAVDHDLEVASPQSRGRVLCLGDDAREHRVDHVDVVRGEVGGQLARVLGPLDQPGEHGEYALTGERPFLAARA